MKKMNMGCGNDIRKGWVNVDFVKKEGIDVVHNLDKYPYPFKDNTFDEIQCIEVLEHLDDTVATVREMHRILKPGGVVEIHVPYYMSYHAWSSPEHKRAFNFQTFKYFIKNTWESNICNLGVAFSSGKIKMAFGRGKNPLNYVLSPLLNAAPDFFEKTPLRIVFHPDGLHVRLVK